MSGEHSIEYRDVQGFPGYRVGDDGSVWSRHWGRGFSGAWRRLRPGTHRKGRRYLCHRLHRDGRRHTRLLHRIVLEAFVGPRPPGGECRHLDGDPTNCALGNLAWGTHGENTADTRRMGRFAVKLTAGQVREIRARYAAGGVLQRELAAEFGTTRMNVSSILNGQSWRHLG